ncbi:MAG: AAA family ATPase, partial [Anaerolineales bacterium]|nr:AAA family ATPase [Anaerolineales bacterium]
MDNPFIYGPALPPEQMVGRRAELRMVLGRLAKRQSTAVIGPPHVGKTTLLQALADDQMRQDLSGNRFERDVFSFVDAMTAHGFASPAEFWQRALLPLADHLSLPTPPAPRRLEMELLPLLRQSFNARDLQDICLALHINYEVLSGQGANDKTRELVILCQQQGRLEALALRMKQVHPHLDVPLPKPPPDPHLTLLQGAYLTAQHEQFGTFVLEQLFRRLHENKQRFVLLIDEFDDFLANPALH